MTAVDCSTITKVCSQCGQEKSVFEFYRVDRGAHGVRGNCKSCSNKASYQCRDKEKDQAAKKEYRKKESYKEHAREYAKIYYAANKELLKERDKAKRDKAKQEIQPVVLPQKQCVKCGDEFLPTVHQQKYCSSECRLAVQKERNFTLSQTDRLLKVCFTCGIEKPLSEYNSNYLCKSGVVRTCKECKKKEYRAEVYGDEQTSKCEYCGNDFLKSNGKTHCSPRCKQSSRTVRNGGIPQPNRKPKQNKPVIDGKKECTICGYIHPVSEYYVCPSTGISHTYCNNCRRLKTRIARGIGKKKRKDGIAWTLRNGLKNNPDSHKSLMNVGYSIDELRIHLERQFTKGMNWEVFNQGKIHIDHILPQASFDLSNPDEWRSCWALPNLRPMWAKQNVAKRAKIETLL